MIVDQLRPKSKSDEGANGMNIGKLVIFISVFVFKLYDFESGLFHLEIFIFRYMEYGVEILSYQSYKY